MYILICVYINMYVINLNLFIQFLLQILYNYILQNLLIPEICTNKTIEIQLLLIYAINRNSRIDVI